ncbi:MAG: cation diffusion facilitator family transporter [Acidimicrobiales bacterium]|jgi:cobalt-zinc-cadmium efflux system protein
MSDHHGHHDGHRHTHAMSPEADMRYLLVALALISCFLIGEIVAAVVGNSLALFADAAHMLTDVAALGMSAWAIRLASRPAEGLWTYGMKRAEILMAAINGVTLVAIALLIGVEAIQRLLAPQHVSGYVVMIVALIGATINVAATWVLSKANRTSLNVRGAYAHIVTDLAAFIGTAVAGLVIVVTGWNRADAVASLVVVGLMVWTAWGLLRDAGKILLQAAPDDLDLVSVRQHLAEVPHVLGVHDLHAWTVTSGSPTLAAHVVVEDHCFDTGHAPQILDALQGCLAEHFDVAHATFQLEPASHASHEDDLHP